jgi:hypothetical protein
MTSNLIGALATASGFGFRRGSQLTAQLNGHRHNTRVRPGRDFLH